MKGGDTPTLACGALRGVVNAKTLAEMPDNHQQQIVLVDLPRERVAIGLGSGLPMTTCVVSFAGIPDLGTRRVHSRAAIEGR